MKLYTIGYEGCEIDEFVRGLKRKKITFVADVRKNPVSRKPGFSKSRLAAKLFEAGIEYEHLPGLGVPTEWRKEAKAEIITRAEMFRNYRQKILPRAKTEISILKRLKKKSNLALLCYERDAHDCHRHHVSKSVTTTKNIVDLDMATITQNLRTRPDRPRSNRL